MLNRKKAEVTDPYFSQVIDNLEELAANMEESFGEMYRNLTTFKIKISEIKRRKLQQLEQTQLSKSEIRKRKVQSKKTLKNLKKDEEVELPFDLQNLNTILGEESSVISLEDNEGLGELAKGEQGSKDKDKIEEDGFLFSQLFEGKNDNWSQFYSKQKERLQKIDPKASPTDIARFAESQWNKMTEVQKAQWKKSSQKKKEGKAYQLKKDKIGTGLLKEEREKNMNSQFSDFISRKLAKSESSPKNEVEVQKQQHQPKKTVSASSLLLALEQSRQKKQVHDTQRVDEKLKKMFHAFQL